MCTGLSYGEEGVVCDFIAGSPEGLGNADTMVAAGIGVGIFPGITLGGRIPD